MICIALDTKLGIVVNLLTFTVKIIRCDTPCENGGNCTGLEQCSCPKDFYGQYCDSKFTV